ncbi:UDP-3-O-acyl-N-acetylglucosamine deacetylase [candidate division WOR-3 bacterium]|nr:UDP-3-O-acyl-N-acetylglucosamine deacetylase [candidate division WOR-3 bacterium]
MTGSALGRPVVLRGLGYRTGRPVTLRLEPGAPNSGIVFNGRRADNCSARVVGHAVRVGRAGMVEHLLAACAGLGIRDLAVTVDGPEMPLLDGSSLPYVRAFARAGLRRAAAPEPLVLPGPVLVDAGAGFIAAVPADRPFFSCLAEAPEFGAAHVGLALTRARFVRELAGARTVAPVAERPGTLRARYRLRFALCRRGRFVAPRRSRMPDEFCRHKLLDVIGDLALLGRPLAAEVFARNPGHRLNLAFVRTLQEAQDDER